MKNKIEIIDDIVIDKFFILTMLDRNVKCLISSKKPLAHKLAIWQKDFKRFKSFLAKQDKAVMNLIESC